MECVVRSITEVRTIKVEAFDIRAIERLTLAPMAVSQVSLTILATMWNVEAGGRARPCGCHAGGTGVLGRGTGSRGKGRNYSTDRSQSVKVDGKVSPRLQMCRPPGIRLRTVVLYNLC